MSRVWSCWLVAATLLTALGCGGDDGGEREINAASESTTTVRVTSGSGDVWLDLGWLPRGLVPGAATTELENGAVVDGVPVEVPTASPGSEMFDFAGPDGVVDLVVVLAPSSQWSHADMRKAIESGSQEELPPVQGRPASAYSPDIDWNSVTVIWSDDLTLFVNGRSEGVKVDDLVRVADSLSVNDASQSPAG